MALASAATSCAFCPLHLSLRALGALTTWFEYRPVRFLLAFLCSIVVGCVPAVPSAPAPQAIAVELVDSIPWSNELGEGTLRRVEVRAGARVDTIRHVLTYEVPTLVRGSHLLGFSYEEDAVVSGYQYDVRTGRVKRLSLPSDFHPTFSAASISPDGRYIAYVVAPGDATGWGMVRTWPRLKLVLRTDQVEVPATDSPGNYTRWLSPDTTEVFVETGYSTENGWYRVRAAVSRKEILAADTVRQLPRE